ncbi:MAG: diacylglycerol kinase family lipid kinase [Anaerolineaceae bacterium]|jgi:YegS/Rv2252/BmrU family lipid kinase|nr:diacylglycerol kinase family lipid kinase [Anaerolineaceae bacterium]
MKKNVRVILNPSAGSKNPPLRIFNNLFQKANIDWDLVITKERCDGICLADQAIHDGVDIVAAYGGDGTVMEVASGLQGTGIPMAILPGGTGNILSVELGIPQNLQEACTLITQPEKSRLRSIDLGITNDQKVPAFALRAGVGLEAAMLEGTDRELKEKYGIFAYIMGATQALHNVKQAHYNLVLDGEPFECTGITCLIANAGYFGVPGLMLDPNVKIDDGLLDVFVLRKMDLIQLFSLAATIVGGNEVKDKALHWQVESVSIEADPVQATQADGEMWGESPLEIKVSKDALQVLVPV